MKRTTTATGWAARAGWPAAFLYLLLLALLPLAARAQNAPPTWAGATSGNNFQPTSGTSLTRATATDPATGNVYATGSFTGSVAFGTTRLVSAGGSDVFVAKWDATAGAWTSAVSGGDTSTDIGYGVAVSSAGGVASVYVTGSFQSGSSANIAGTALAGAGGSDVFVAKYTDPGTGLSPTNGGAVSGGGTGSDIGYGVALLGQQVYVGGSATPSASFGSFTLANPAGSTINVLARVVDATLVPPTSLSSVSPAAELPGQVVTLTGTGFTSASTVSFGGVAASGLLYRSSTSLDAVVPAGAATGSAPVSVTTGGSTTTSQPFTVLEVYNGGALGDCAAAVPATASLNDGQWHYLLSGGGQVVAAYNYTGTSLGNLALDVLRADPAQPVRQDGSGRKYLDRNWHLSASAGRFDGRTVGLRFYALNTELTRLQSADATATLPALKATQYSGANEDCDLANDDPAGEYRLLAPTASSQPADVAWFDVELAVADHFSEFFLNGGNAPLPVELVRFTAVAQGPATVRLAWATASEVNSARFEVERSLDGAAFTKIGGVGAAGTSAAAHAYALTDAALPPAARLLYYRLRQVDLDGTAHYSPVRTVVLSGAAAGLALYPNPTPGAATLTGAEAGALVQVLDALGRVVATAPADASGTAPLPGGLPAGVYVVRSGARAVRLTVE